MPTLTPTADTGARSEPAGHDRTSTPPGTLPTEQGRRSWTAPG